MASVLSITDDPSVIPASALAQTPAADALQQRRARFETRVQELRRQEAAAAAAVAADLRRHPGYYPAAVSRNRDLLAQHAERPDLRWAMVRWAEIFDTGGLPMVLHMLAHPEEHQELLSSAPFYLMRPPLPENAFYQAYAPSPARHR